MMKMTHTHTHTHTPLTLSPIPILCTGKTIDPQIVSIPPLRRDMLKTLARRLQGPYSSTIFQNVISPVLQIFLQLAAFECNTTSDWQNHTV